MERDTRGFIFIEEDRPWLPSLLTLHLFIISKCHSSAEPWRCSWRQQSCMDACALHSWTPLVISDMEFTFIEKLRKTKRNKNSVFLLLRGWIFFPPPCGYSGLSRDFIDRQQDSKDDLLHLFLLVIIIIFIIPFSVYIIHNTKDNHINITAF